MTEEGIGDWIDDYRSDPDAVAAAIDWDALRVDSGRRIKRWNSLGATLCERFLEHVRTLSG